MKYFIFILSVVTISSCKKYPEGGFLRQGPKAFIANDKIGLWGLSLYEVNGIDSTHLIHVPIITNGKDFYSSFLGCDYIDNNKKNGLAADNYNYSYRVEFINKNADMTFSDFSSDNSQCISTTNGVSCQRNIFNPEGVGLVTFKILKLKDKECILTTTLNNSYKIILKR